MLQLSYEDDQGILMQDEIHAYLERQSDKLHEAEAGNPQYKDSLGWLEPDEWAGEEMLSLMEQKAEEVRKNADVFVLIGVGGSNNGARAVIKALKKQGMPKVIYAGNSISPHSMNQVLEELKGKSVYINVIAKNFETLEPGIGFRILRGYLEDVYGDKAGERIIATGTSGSHLEDLCRRHGYSFLAFPENIGGRYSAVSSVGLFPMAVAGMDIRKLAAGAKDMRRELLLTKGPENQAFTYAAIRNLLYQKGYRIEMLSFFEPRFRYFAKWWTQLFAESEGKDGKGVYPVSAECSEDLHSVGQFVQDGSPVIYETFLDLKNQDSSCMLEAGTIDDGFGYLNGLDFWNINRTAMEATMQAHKKKLPVFCIQVETLDEYTFGQLFYFFEYACFLSGLMLGVNPFDQPGVEAYKGYMFQALGK